MPAPDHYCELAPFAELFARGAPALLYHRLGWSPLLTRSRGLTLPLRLFRRQLRELHCAGYQACASLDHHQDRRIWITFDDGDRTSMAALPALAEYGFRAIQFLVADRIGGVNDWDRSGFSLMDEGDVRTWLAAGHLVGSHTATHPRLLQLSRTSAREEIGGSKRKLEDRFGCAIDYFAYPWGEWNCELADEVASAGYRGAFTVEPGVNLAATSPYGLRRHTVWCSLRKPRELFLAVGLR